MRRGFSQSKMMLISLLSCFPPPPSAAEETAGTRFSRVDLKARAGAIMYKCFPVCLRDERGSLQMHYLRINCLDRALLTRRGTACSSRTHLIRLEYVSHNCIGDRATNAARAFEEACRVGESHALHFNRRAVRFRVGLIFR